MNAVVVMAVKGEVTMIAVTLAWCPPGKPLFEDIPDTTEIDFFHRYQRGHVCVAIETSRRDRGKNRDFPLWMRTKCTSGASKYPLLSFAMRATKSANGVSFSSEDAWQQSTSHAQSTDRSELRQLTDPSHSSAVTPPSRTLP